MPIKSNPLLVTQRLMLRHFIENDLEALFKLLRDEGVNTFLPWFPVKNMEETEYFFKGTLLR